MGISVGITEIEYPDYVNELFAELTQDIKEKIIKSVIFQNVEKIESRYDREYLISSFFQKMSNRVPVLDKKGVKGSIFLTASLLMHHIYQLRDPEGYKRAIENMNTEKNNRNVQN